MIHNVRRGDTIVQIARKYGFRAIAPIWDHPENAALRSRRPNPFVLAQGDAVFIPDKEPEEHSCQTNQRHVFRLRGMTQWLHQRLLDEESRPLAGKKFELTVGGKSFDGLTDGAGEIRVQIPLDATTGDLKVWLTDGDAASCREWTLRLGHLEPVETTFGLKGHLVNLGYDCAPVDDAMDDRTKQALTAFQNDHGLAATGQNDAATQAKLRELFRYPVESGA